MVDVTSAPYLRDTITRIVFVPGSGNGVIVSRNAVAGLAEMGETKQAKRMIHDLQAMTLLSAEACDMATGTRRIWKGDPKLCSGVGWIGLFRLQQVPPQVVL